MGCYIWYSEEGFGRAAAPPSPLLAVPNVTAHPSTASVPISVLLYDGPLLCGFNVAIKGLREHVPQCSAAAATEHDDATEVKLIIIIIIIIIVVIIILCHAAAATALTAA